jgi:hypothetical protein
MSVHRRRPSRLLNSHETAILSCPPPTRTTNSSCCSRGSFKWFWEACKGLVSPWLLRQTRVARCSDTCFTPADASHPSPHPRCPWAHPVSQTECLKSHRHGSAFFCGHRGGECQLERPRHCRSPHLLYRRFPLPTSLAALGGLSRSNTCHLRLHGSAFVGTGVGNVSWSQPWHCFSAHLLYPHFPLDVAGSHGRCVPILKSNACHPRRFRQKWRVVSFATGRYTDIKGCIEST